MSQRIAIVHPRIGFGGSEVTAFWMLEALCPLYDVTLVTSNAFDLEVMNSFCGTRLLPEAFRHRIVRSPMAGMRRFDLLRGAFFCRAARRLPDIRAADLRISAYNLLPLGGTTLHSLADFSWDDATRRQYDGTSGRGSGLRGLYRGLSRVIAGPMDEGAVAAEDLVFANSAWSQAVLSERHGIQAPVIFPPVPGPPAPGPSDQTARSTDFVLLGRISPEKRIGEAIDLLGRVRALGHRVKLHILGDFGPDPYALKIQSQAAEHGDWIVLHGGVYGVQKWEKLQRHGFALHMRQKEPFGIAVAELCAAGVLTLHPTDSAPAEIVGQPGLQFADTADAVQKISDLLSDPARQTELRREIQARAKRFEPQRFVAKFQGLVASMLS